MERDLENGECASIRPPPRGGCRPKEEGFGIATAERKERAAGGVLRGAVDAGFRMVYPQRDCFVHWRGEVVIAATADRSTPPVAAPAVCLLPCIRHPFMAAPPPSRRGEGPVALLAPCIRGIPWGGHEIPLSTGRIFCRGPEGFRATLWLGNAREAAAPVQRKGYSFACFRGRAASPFAAGRLPSAWKAFMPPPFARRAGDCPPYRPANTFAPR